MIISTQLLFHITTVSLVPTLIIGPKLTFFKNIGSSITKSISNSDQYQIEPKKHYKILFIIGPIDKPKKKMEFVTDEKGKIKWNFEKEILENKFTPKGFKNSKSTEPATILVTTHKEERILAKYTNYANMKKEMAKNNGKLYHENHIKFIELENVLGQKRKVMEKSGNESENLPLLLHDQMLDEDVLNKPKKLKTKTDNKLKATTKQVERETVEQKKSNKSQIINREAKNKTNKKDFATESPVNRDKHNHLKTAHKEHNKREKMKGIGKASSQMPTKVHSQMPTKVHSQMPTKVHSHMPTNVPSQIPTKVPSQMPTEEPELYRGSANSFAEDIELTTHLSNSESDQEKSDQLPVETHKMVDGKACSPCEDDEQKHSENEQLMEAQTYIEEREEQMNNDQQYSEGHSDREEEEEHHSDIEEKGANEEEVSDGSGSENNSSRESSAEQIKVQQNEQEEVFIERTPEDHENIDRETSENELKLSDREENDSSNESADDGIPEEENAGNKEENIGGGDIGSTIESENDEIEKKQEEPTDNSDIENKVDTEKSDKEEKVNDDDEIGSSDESVADKTETNQDEQKDNLTEVKILKEESDDNKEEDTDGGDIDSPNVEKQQKKPTDNSDIEKLVDDENDKVNNGEESPSSNETKDEENGSSIENANETTDRELKQLNSSLARERTDVENSNDVIDKENHAKEESPYSVEQKEAEHTDGENNEENEVEPSNGAVPGVNNSEGEQWNLHRSIGHQVNQQDSGETDNEGDEYTEDEETDEEEYEDEYHEENSEELEEEEEEEEEDEEGYEDDKEEKREEDEEVGKGGGGGR